MARRFHIFIESDVTLDQFAKQLSVLLGLSLQPKADEYERWYEAYIPNGFLDVGKHNFDDDKDMNFESYRFDLRIWPQNVVTEEDWQKALKTMACPIFEKLKAAGRYSLMLVEDLQVKLDEFHPQLTAR